MNALKQLLSEDSGNLSTTRVITFLVVVSVLVTQTYYSIVWSCPLEFTNDQLTLVLGAMGIKTVQRAAESINKKTYKAGEAGDFGKPSQTNQ